MPKLDPISFSFPINISLCPSNHVFRHGQLYISGVGKQHYHRIMIDHLSYRIFRRFAATPRIHYAEFINHGVKFINPMTFVKGWCPERIVHCEMHVVHLGICQWLNASATILLAEYGYLGGGKLADQLNALTGRFNKWCSMNQIRHLENLCLTYIIYSDLFFWGDTCCCIFYHGSIYLICFFSLGGIISLVFP